MTLVFASRLPFFVVLSNAVCTDKVDEYQHLAGLSSGPLYRGRERTRLAIGRFLHDLATDLQLVQSGQSKAKLLLYSGHDSTLGPLLEALQAFDDRHPAMGAYIALELYEYVTSFVCVRCV